MPIALIALAVGTFAAAAIDVRSGRIPNALTGAMAVAAITIHVFDGTLVLAAALAAMAAAFALGTLAFSAGWLGGGDAKLIAAACGLAGYPGAISLVLFVLVAGAALALTESARQGRLMPLVRSALGLALTGTAPKTRTILPYGVAIAGGTLFYVVSTVSGLRLRL